MNPRKGEPTGAERYACHIEVGKGGDERMVEEVAEIFLRSGNSGANRETG